MLSFLYVLLALALLEAVFSLRGGYAFRRRLLQALASEAPTAPLPPVTLIVPCRGIDPGLAANLSAFRSLDYPDREILFVLDSANDPAAAEIQAITRADSDCRLLIAPTARDRGQKVENLMHAIDRMRAASTVLAFADSDIRPHRSWLRDLVAPLDDKEVGLSTGFRWYVPQRANTASVLRAVWNAGIASLLSGEDVPFAWGGAMAIRRETFDRVGGAGAWDGALSDDFALSRAVHEAGLRIRFEPRCLSLSHEDSDWRELLAWSHRQLAITRIHRPDLWGAALAAQTIHSTALWGALFYGFWGLMRPDGSLAAAWTILAAAAIYLLGCWKAAIRLDAVRRTAAAVDRHRWAYWTWGPAASLITLAGLIRTLFSREIRWRGIRYRMLSRGETVVLPPSE